MPRFMLLQHYEGGAGCDVPMSEWAPEDVEAHIRFQHVLNAELEASGELVDAQGLAWPDAARTVVSDGTKSVVTEGPFPETRELVAGYRMIDVDSLERAIEIAARASAAPGARGVAIQQPIEVREVMRAPGGDD
jgi:hypothetical protein